MKPGVAFEATVQDGDIYRMVYTSHFVGRFELDEPDHPAVRRTVSEAVVEEKIREAIPQIDDIVYGKSLKGAIVSRSQRFVMLFDAVEIRGGRQVNMTTMSGKVDFRVRSAKEVVIEVNPEFTVRFSAPFSLGLKLSILADIAANWETLQSGTMYHLGGNLMDYWLERSGDEFFIPMADWQEGMVEVEVS